MADFDAQRMDIALQALSGLSGQKIFTIPVAAPLLIEGFGKIGAQQVNFSA